MRADHGVRCPTRSGAACKQSDCGVCWSASVLLQLMVLKRIRQDIKIEQCFTPSRDAQYRHCRPLPVQSSGFLPDRVDASVSATLRLCQGGCAPAVRDFSDDDLLLQQALTPGATGQDAVARGASPAGDTRSLVGVRLRGGTPGPLGCRSSKFRIIERSNSIMTRVGSASRRPPVCCAAGTLNRCRRDEYRWPLEIALDVAWLVPAERLS